MTPRLALDAIESLIRSMPSCVERDRCLNYATIKVIADELRRHARARGVSAGPLEEKMVQLLTAAEELAELKVSRGEPAGSAERAIKSLRSLMKWNHEEQTRLLAEEE